MKASFIVAAALLISASVPAFAQTEERMSDGRYIAASRCLAYAELSQLSGDTFNTVALKTAFDSQNPTSGARQRAGEETSDAQRAGRRAGDNAISVEMLRSRRNAACEGFVATGLVQASAVSTPS